MTASSEAETLPAGDAALCISNVNGRPCGHTVEWHQAEGHPHLFQPPGLAPVKSAGLDVRKYHQYEDPELLTGGVFDTREEVYARPWTYPEDDEAAPLPAFPVHALPGDMGKFAHALAVYQQVSVDIPALIMLGGLAVIAGGYASVTGHWREKTLNLYLAALAESGETKSDIIDAVVTPIYALETKMQKEYEENHGDMAKRHDRAKKRRDSLVNRLANAKTKSEIENLESDLNAIEKEIKETTPPPRPQLLEGDTTPEALALTMQETGGHIGMIHDEGGFLGILAGRYTQKGAANIDLVLQAYDAKLPFRQRRVGRGKVNIDRPSLSMAMCVQPVIIKEAADNPALVDRGFLYRFLFCEPTSLAGHRDKRPPKVPGYLHDEWARIVRSVYDAVLPDGTPFDIKTKEMKPPLSLEIGEIAEELHYQWRVELEKRVDPDEGDLAALKGWAKKLEGTAYRIAALLHLASGDPGRLVGEQAMRDALAIADWAIPHTVAVLGGSAAATDPAEAGGLKARAAILAWARRKQKTEFTIRDVQQALKRQAWVKDTGSDGVRAALRELVVRGYLTTVKRHGDDGKEQKDGLFLVHPQVLGRQR